MMIMTSAMRPKSFGESNRARTIEMTSWILCVPMRSMNFQKREKMTMFFDGIVLVCKNG